MTEVQHYPQFIGISSWCVHVNRKKGDTYRYVDHIPFEYCSRFVVISMFHNSRILTKFVSRAKKQLQENTKNGVVYPSEVMKIIGEVLADKLANPPMPQNFEKWYEKFTHERPMTSSPE